MLRWLPLFSRMFWARTYVYDAYDHTFFTELHIIDTDFCRTVRIRTRLVLTKCEGTQEDSPLLIWLLGGDTNTLNFIIICSILQGNSFPPRHIIHRKSACVFGFFYADWAFNYKIGSSHLLHTITNQKYLNSTSSVFFLQLTTSEQDSLTTSQSAGSDNYTHTYVTTDPP